MAPLSRPEMVRAVARKAVSDETTTKEMSIQMPATTLPAAVCGTRSP